MTITIIGLVMFAALLHAVWNAILRSGEDPLWSVTVKSFATTIGAAIFALFIPIPHKESWNYLIISSALQLGCSIFLAYAYKSGQLWQVYPVVRGSIPLLVTLGGILFMRQYPSATSLMGVLLIVAGIASLIYGRGGSSILSVLYAIVAGLFVASYVSIDSIGVRLAGNPLSYAAWMFLIYGIMTPVAFIGLRRKSIKNVVTQEALKAMSGGVVSLTGYAAFTVALSLGPVGPISALRETSVVFSAIISWLFLGEALTILRVLSCVVVSIGAACVALKL
ncbi:MULTISPECIES: DMT family transporter [unclassified Paraburkholderia]|uniref:DMT family transporter n=1 Tax=unclassified Paraburkholderia TaxID=2615204 RepID=UPI002AAFD909|nr:MULTISPECIES: DMT family transporter [unclassified Paraburkholderia]